MSGASIKFTLWGQQAEAHSYNDHPVIGIKGAKIGDFGGRSLNAGFDSFIQINPDIPMAHRLRGWFDSQGSTLKFNSFSGNGAVGSAITKTIKQVANENLGMNEKVCIL